MPFEIHSTWKTDPCKIQTNTIWDFVMAESVGSIISNLAGEEIELDFPIDRLGKSIFDLSEFNLLDNRYKKMSF